MGFTLTVALLLAGISASAQVRSPQSASQSEQNSDDANPPVQLQRTEMTTQQAGQVADSVVGKVGERQTRDQMNNVVPTDRLDGRIQNRIQSRVRNRIDRYYDPRANATSPFKIAAEQASTASRARVR